ncbi:PREDICTED: aminoacylase-1-like [Papilio polytes]|uniref:aminoacylase-1-like n=1 Tax=Papilio polytes TaxID=76194 RepID=UPI0006761B98|nr:PREDICTED: aminoacylase-1-like [Papilio polytes]
MLKCLLFCVIFILFQGIEGNGTAEDLAAVRLLQKYLQINTTTGNDQSAGIQFWRTLAQRLKASFNTYEYLKGYPVVVIRKRGVNSKLSSIALISHIDVAPVADEGKWKYPPFGGNITKDGLMYGRGVQDCKTVSIQYYEALLNLTKRNVKLQRDVVIILFTSHEIGLSSTVIRSFLTSKEFTSMSVGGGIDEGFTYSSNKLLLLYQDKAILVLQIDCYGIETHGSLMPDSNKTAIGVCAKVITSLQAYRDAQVEYMKTLAVTDTSNYTSINLNRLQGAITDSVLPGRITLRYYINPSINKTVIEVFNEVKARVDKINAQINLTIVRSAEKSPAVRLDASNPFYKAIYDAAKSLNFDFSPTITFDQTNAGALRKYGIPILGFSPLPKTQFLDHGYDEFVDVRIFLSGIPLYIKCIQNLANIPDKEVTNDPSKYLIDYDKKKYN